MKTPINIIEASQMAKKALIEFLFEDEASKISEDFHQNKWKMPKKGSPKYHYPTHARDTRDGSIINLIEYGKRICLIE